MEQKSSKNPKSHANVGALQPDNLRCPDCLRPFTRRDHLNEHIKNIHDSSPEKLYYLCPMPECTSQFLYASNFRVHLKANHKMLDTDVKKLDPKSYRESKPSKGGRYCEIETIKSNYIQFE